MILWALPFAMKPHLVKSRYEEGKNPGELW